MSVNSILVFFHDLLTYRKDKQTKPHKSQRILILKAKGFSITDMYEIRACFGHSQQGSPSLKEHFTFIWKSCKFHTSFSFRLSSFPPSKNWSNKPTKIHFLPEECEQMSKKQALKLQEPPGKCNFMLGLCCYHKHRTTGDH